MNERNRRSGRRQRDYRQAQGSHERGYAQDQPWREERRHRYPDEPYGGPRGRSFADDWQGSRGGGWEANRDWRGRPEGYGDREGWGPGYGYGVSDSGEYRAPRRGDHGWDEGSRSDERGWGDRGWRQDAGGWRDRNARERWSSGPSFGFGPAEMDRGGGGGYGYGSPYGQGDMNTGRAGRGDWQDTDWVPNRPARGRRIWAGDWAMGPSGGGAGEDYSGRGPRDYRRSDDRIRDEICEVFTDDSRLDPSDVVVKVESGDVTLMGTVSTRDQKRRAEEIAERIGGVRDVSNQLRVSRGETTTGTSAAQPSGRATRGGPAGQQQGVAADRDR